MLHSVGLACTVVFTQRMLCKLRLLPLHGALGATVRRSVWKRW